MCRQSSRKVGKESLWWTRVKYLRWTRPHSLSGILALVTGSFLSACSLNGHLSLYTDHGSIYVIIYCIATIANAAFGYQIADKAGSKHFAFMFRVTALVQICLAYFIPRFLPLDLWASLASYPAGRLGLALLDGMVAVSLVWTTLSCGNATNGSNPNLDLGLRAGIPPLLLVATYPIQFAWGSIKMVLNDYASTIHSSTMEDNTAASLEAYDYWNCIHQRYPAQGLGMVAFIYVPTTLAFSLMIFGATLYLRKILTELQFGVGVGGTAMLTLVLMVGHQEVYLPYVSTQRIYLPCTEPEPGTWEEWITHSLDFSVLARSVLKNLGVELAPVAFLNTSSCPA